MLTLLTGLVCGALQSSAPSPGYITAKTFIASGYSSAAAGNGTTDDTNTLQAAINYSIAHNVALRFEPGVYRITKGLVIEGQTSESFPAGFLMEGIPGPNRTNSTTSGGVEIMLDGNSAEEHAVLTIGNAAFRDSNINNIAFVSRVSNLGTPYGILFSGQRFSHFVLHNVQVGNVNTAYAVVNNSADCGNGEQVDLDACMATNVSTFYANDSGQAYCHHLYACNANLVNGGTCFKMGSSVLGFSLDVFGFTSTFAEGPLRNTFFENDGVSGNINFFGGRQECVDTVLAYTTGSHNCNGLISLTGLQFTNFENKFPLIQTIGITNVADWTNSFTSCQFDGANGTAPVLRITSLSGDNTLNVFDKCQFRSISGLTGPCKYRDSRASSSGGSPLVSIPNN